VSPVKYELGLYIPEEDILHSHCRENLKSYIDIIKFIWSDMILSLYSSFVLVKGTLFTWADIGQSTTL
jgi:hypothetical protein